MKYLLILLFLFLFFFTFGCSSSEKKYSIKIDSLQVYGDNGKNMMSFIGDFKYLNGKVYILDVMQKKIFIYSINGEIIKQIQLRTGNGPGDFTKGLFAFEVISDTTLAIVDYMKDRIQLISTNYNYLGGFYVKYHPMDIFYMDSLLYVTGDDFNALINSYTLKGEKVSSLIKPFSLKGQPQPWFSNVDIDEDLSIYFSNPYKTEIIKWQNNSNIWDYSNKKLDLISPPRVRNRGGKFAISNPSKGWAKLFIHQDYVIASTYNYNAKKEVEVKPKILIIDKITGKLLYIQDEKTKFIADSFEDGKYVFMVSNEPYPHLNRINLKIVKE